MRFDNASAQRDWNRKCLPGGSRASSGLYALAATMVSLLWVVDLALHSEGSPIAWAAPQMIVAGVLIAFAFRSHFRRASWPVAALTAIPIGFVCSVVATLPWALYGVFSGPLVFLTFWPVTFPLSWFSFWFMKMADARLMRRSEVANA